MKPRILWCGEASVLNTGYSVYCREVLSRLHQSQKYEIAELASYVSREDPRLSRVPWKVYPNLPDRDNQEQAQAYSSNPENQFGAWRFEDVCLDFLPTHVLDIRDAWMMSYEFSSPFRPYYNHMIMPTVDAPHQNEEWLSTYETANTVFTYQDWSLETLIEESNGRIPVIKSAPPCANSAFQPLDKKELKKQLGLSDFKIVGTVMRNQRRKLYPELFKSFRQYLDKTGNKTLLYCHTSYPDRGWDLPQLINENSLSSKVLFTYVCKECGHSFPQFFSDSISYCSQCGKRSATCSNVQIGVNNETLCRIYNLFDVYVQYACAEGFGMPIVEAAACGVPVMAVDFSAMNDVVRKLNGVPLKVLTTYTELETGCYRAVPDNNYLIEKLIWFFNLPEQTRKNIQRDARIGFEQNYNWDWTADAWMEEIDKDNPEELMKRWYNQPKTHTPSTQAPNVNNRDFARWLITDVLGEPERLNTYMESRLIRDLNYGTTVNHMHGMYFHEMSQLFSGDNRQHPFNREIAYHQMVNMCNKRNYWENIRWEKLQKQEG